MAVGCITAVFLDNALPGSVEDRGIKKWRQLLQTEDDKARPTASIHVYDPFTTKCWVNRNWLKYVPFLPYYPSTD